MLAFGKSGHVRNVYERGIRTREQWKGSEKAYVSALLKC